jgi:hypothetical protein
MIIKFGLNLVYEQLRYKENKKCVRTTVDMEEMTEMKERGRERKKKSEGTRYKIKVEDMVCHPVTKIAD